MTLSVRLEYFRYPVPAQFPRWPPNKLRFARIPDAVYCIVSLVDFKLSLGSLAPSEISAFCKMGGYAVFGSSLGYLRVCNLFAPATGAWRRLLWRCDRTLLCSKSVDILKSQSRGGAQQ